MVDIAMDSLMDITDSGWWLGSLYVALVNIVVATVVDKVHNRYELLWKVVSSYKCG